jgi:hypothetical protein
LELVTSKDDIELVEVASSGDLNKFIKLPFAIYKGDPFSTARKIPFIGLPKPGCSWLARAANISAA